MLLGLYGVVWLWVSSRGSCPWIWYWSFLGHDSRNWTKQGSPKTVVLVVMDPPQKKTYFFGWYQCWLNCVFFLRVTPDPWTTFNISRKNIFLFSSWYQCWLNCQIFFFAGNPWSVNNVQHFAKKWFWSKFRPQLQEFPCSMIQERVHQNLYISFYSFYVSINFVKTIFK